MIVIAVVVVFVDASKPLAIFSLQGGVLVLSVFSAGLLVLLHFITPEEIAIQIHLPHSSLQTPAAGVPI